MRSLLQDMTGTLSIHRMASAGTSALRRVEHRSHVTAQLEASAVDEALSDDAPIEPSASCEQRPGRDENGVDGPHPASGPLLKSLVEQLASLEAQQRQIRALLETVERAGK